MKVLFIDTDSSIDEILEDVSQDYIVDRAATGNQGLLLFEVNDYDALVIDSTLPDISGVEVCRLARQVDSDISLLVLTEKNDVECKVSSLDAGADAYITKPVNPKELHANIRSYVRRSYLGRLPSKLSAGVLSLDMCQKRVWFKEEEIILRRKEYELLEFLFLNKGKAVSKEKILEHVWDGGIFVFSNTVEVHIRRLRDKIERPNNVKLIKTLRGFGYKMEEYIC
jgi:two-component system response regulator ArlR